MQLLKIGGIEKLSEISVGDIVMLEVTKLDEQPQPPVSQCRFGRYLGYLGIENGEQLTFSFEGLPSMVFRSQNDKLTISIVTSNPI